MKTIDGSYIQESNRRRNSRTAFLTFTLNLGSTDKNMDKRKRPDKREREPDIDDDF